MRTTKLFRSGAVFLGIGLLCAGCSTGPKNSNEANGNWSPAKQGMTRDQFIAQMHARMAQGQVGAPQTKVPPGAPGGTAPSAAK